METYNLKNDIKVFYVTSKSFPDGIMEAWDKINNMLQTKEGRIFYGISKPDNGVIIYKAAVAESFEGEAEKYGCETFTIRKGKYATETILGWMKKTEAIGKTFQSLLTHPDLDKSSSCIEWYKSENEVMCMVRLNEAK